MSALTFIKNVSRPLRIKYYDWKHWNDLKNKIKRHGRDVPKMEQEIQYINKPGIVFSFDDSFRVDGWYKHVRDLFGYYDIKATFNVNAFHHFEGQREHTQEEIDQLLELQSHGHEIAHHTYKHQNAVLYANEFGIKKWIEDEIEPLFNWLEKQQHSKTREKFKRPVSFAFPFFVKDDKTIKALSPKYFKVVRGGPNEKLVTPFNQTGVIPSIDIDKNLIPNPRNIKKLIRHLKQSRCNIILTCHSVLEDNINWHDFDFGEEGEDAGQYRISPETLSYIIKEAKKKNLEFYTTSEIAGIATFIDENFENHVRDILSIPSDQWIKISDLISIKELDLSNKEINNLDGLQYFLNLEKLDISNNDINDLRLVERLPKLKNIINQSKLKEEIV
ncbi:peptidoglycan/xylan/chitin deacetylase (PgdA/CDA1 family) [Pullulanibacillus pueri]|uniref:NodB homology domain-containing protein n=1 Tax=Pullulanibacillus pueri TaxID=1437324 RepID=A0A8J2ZWK3_9BACL|nr:polysaccharide deacetylase family protein [Pullulanibacillus pueri]MBM7682440.1 peptidoglycan/xylan/chitin deacetylase (PgdA/CDA1 family) [Pullulanibacillus pueri]GGH81631.1 hypothetical protein GCM10007096_19810 [Pullulanibacillus pueri]